MSHKPPGRPSLKLTFSKPKVPLIPNQSAPSTAPPTPSTPGPSLPKLKLKLGGPKPTPSPAPEAANASKPKKSAKQSTPSFSKEPSRSSKKRSRDATTASTAPIVKRIKFSTKPLPSLRLKSKGEPPKRPRGVGYDSGASDTEIDPALEEEFVLRMLPGDDCEYVRKAIEEKRFGPRSQGGADISIKALTRDARRATVTVRGKLYAATMVDLPCIVEGMKSWDKRGWYKSADICQMLLVLGPVKSDDEARAYPLPKEVEESFHQYPHGLTPPMRWVRKRRFRKRISNRTIEAVELEVARLMQEDAEAVKPPDFEVMDYNQYMREESGMNEEYDDEQDAEGEADETTYMDNSQDGMGDLFEDDLAAEMEAALAAHAEANSAAASAIIDGNQTVGSILDASHAAEAEPKTATAGESSGDDDSEESSPEDANGLDEDALEQQRQLQQQREEIAELEALVRAETLKWEQMANPILKGKIGRRVQSLKQELELKKVSIGEGNADD